MNNSVSSWRSLLLRIGDKCPEYGGVTDFKEHIDACYGYLSRELEHSKDDISVMCSKVILPGSVVEAFETMLSSAATTVDEEVGNPAWQSRADFYVTCILSCLPWCGAELSEQVPDEIDRVMAGVQSYFSIRKHTPEIGFQVFESVEDKVINEKDFLEDVWDRIQDLTNNGWKVDSVPRPHLEFEAQLVIGKSHDFAPICCPEQPPHPPPPSTVSFGKEKHIADLKYPRRLRRLNIFPASKVELLLLPQAPFKPLYYTLVIIDLCKALPGAFPSVVAGAVRALFERISDMDMECRTRLILWFSHHLF